VDLTDKEGVMNVVQRCVARVSKGHLIRGVFQCAAVVKDAVFENMTWADWQIAFLPKAKGSLNLVDCVLQMNQHPAFIFLSSSAG
ncbi:KR domain-containing protein, partial [Listeria monocytogenes]|nr:KR domain-containing protein [Listeria monocytogenes]